MAYANSFSDLDRKLLSGEYDAAKQQIDEMYKTKSIVTSRAVKVLHSYEKIMKAMISLKNFREAASAFDDSKRLESDFSNVRYAYSSYNSQWSAMPKKLPVSTELVDHLNNTDKELRDRFAVIEMVFKEAEKQRKLAAEANHENELKKIAAEEARKRAIEKNKKQKIIAAERAKNEAHEAKLNTINNDIIKNGYKGLNKQYGIGLFLYNAMRGIVQLESGLDYVFWTELTEKDKDIDNKWRLTQVVDDYEIYKIVEFSGSELITLTIAIPAQSKMPIEGQILKDGLYLFVGNIDFVSTMGIPMLVQGFKPLGIDLKK